MVRMRRTIVVGDVHGQLQALRGLLQSVDISLNDQIVFVGDLIDRGPDGPGVVQLVADYCRARMAVLVMGNHEYKAIRHRKNGTAVDGSDAAMLSQELVDFLAYDTVLHHSFVVGEQKYLAVHGGVSYGIDVLPPPRMSDWRGGTLTGKEKRRAEGMLYVRSDDEEPWTDSYDGRFGIVLYGHSAARDFQIKEHSIGLDIGAGVGYGQLGAIVLEEGVAPRYVRQQI